MYVARSFIRLKNKGTYLKRMNHLHWGKSFDFITPADSVGWRCKTSVLPQFCAVLVSLAAESCRSRAESIHLLKTYLMEKEFNFVIPDDSAETARATQLTRAALPELLPTISLDNIVLADQP